MHNAKLLEKVQTAQEDPELLSLRRSLALVKVRTLDLIDRIDSGESQERWANALESFSDFKGKRGSMLEDKAFGKLCDIMDAAFQDYASWRQIFESLDLERKLSESETARLKAMQQTMNAEDVARIVTNLHMAIIRIVNDPRKLRLIEHEFIRISGIGSSAPDERKRPEAGDVFDSSGVGAVELLDSRATRPDSPATVSD